MNNPTQKQLAYLKTKIEFYFDKHAIDTEFRRDEFPIGSGQIARLSWYIDNMEVHLSVRIYDDETYTITRSTPENVSETGRQQTPDDMQQIVVNVANWNNWNA